MRKLTAVMSLLAIALIALLCSSTQAHADGERDETFTGFLKKTKASPTLLGTLSSASASVNNSTTAAPFTVTKGAYLVVQCSAAAWVNQGVTSAAAVAAATTSLKATADEKYEILLKSSDAFVAMMPVVASATTCLVFQRQ